MSSRPKIAGQRRVEKRIRVFVGNWVRLVKSGTTDTGERFSVGEFMKVTGTSGVRFHLASPASYDAEGRQRRASFVPRDAFEFVAGPYAATPPRAQFAATARKAFESLAVRTTENP